MPKKEDIICVLISISVFAFIFWYVYLRIVYLSFCLSNHLSIYQSFFLSLYMYLYLCICIFICMYVCIYTSLHMCMYIYIYTCFSMFTHISIYIYMCDWGSACVWTDFHVYNSPCVHIFACVLSQMTRETSQSPREWIQLGTNQASNLHKILHWRNEFSILQLDQRKKFCAPGRKYY